MANLRRVSSQFAMPRYWLVLGWFAAVAAGVAMLRVADRSAPEPMPSVSSVAAAPASGESGGERALLDPGIAPALGPHSSSPDSKRPDSATWETDLGIVARAGSLALASVTNASPQASALGQGSSRRRRFDAGPAGPLSRPPMPVDGPLGVRAPMTRPGGSPYEFYFTRAAYSGFGLQGFASWSVDYPKADRQFLVGLQRLLGRLDAYSFENPILLTDPRLLEFPFLYAVEVGHMRLSDDEVRGLRRYLQSGGFLMLDDFWGSYEWANLESEMERILPGLPIVDLDLEHPIFHCFYDIEGVVQVPNVGLGRMGGPTFEKDGYYPKVRGIFGEDGRLLVAMTWNSDLGDAWEWAEDAYYPLMFSTYAYQVGVNFIVYAMTH